MNWTAPQQIYIEDMAKLHMPLASHGAIGESATYHSMSCVCDHCIREDYAICQYSPEGSLTMATWRKFYGTQRRAFL
jgi:hypothetical protein